MIKTFSIPKVLNYTILHSAFNLFWIWSKQHIFTVAHKGHIKNKFIKSICFWYNELEFEVLNLHLMWWICIGCYTYRPPYILLQVCKYIVTSLQGYSAAYPALVLPAPWTLNTLHLNIRLLNIFLFCF